jgi:predicted metal-dependent HD superfamily phosphohydrolase
MLKISDMPEQQPQLVSAAQEYVTNIFLNKVNKTFKYHNLEHTKGVVGACEKIAEYYQLQPEDRAALLIAAWFHDSGFSSGETYGHEAQSIKLATAFLQEHSADATMIEKISSCINATKMPQSPGSLIEQIICDADLAHLGTDDFSAKNELLRLELTDFSKEEISKKKWRKMNIAFLENHKYFTDYGRRKLQPVKEQHLDNLKNKIDESKKGKKDKKQDEFLTVITDDLTKDTEAKKKKEKDNQTERGISTVFRIMANNHASLSQMADSKANIMISVNAIILSLLISNLVRHLDDNQRLVWPTVMLVLSCVAAIIFAVLATRPNVSEGTFTKEDIQNKKTNLLFFGNFHNMTLPDYDWAMKEMLGDRDYLYGSMVKDLYFLGVVLAKKYRYLRISYNIFMYGLILSMLTYGAVMIYDAIFVTEQVPLQYAP